MSISTFTYMCPNCHSFQQSNVAACLKCGAENPHLAGEESRDDPALQKVSAPADVDLSLRRLESRARREPRASIPRGWFVPLGLLSFCIGLLLMKVLSNQATSDHGVRIDQSSWPSVQGTILASRLRCHPGGGDLSYWAFDVQFAYDVNGQRYSGLQEFWWWEVISKSDLDENTRFLSSPPSHYFCGFVMLSDRSMAARQEAVKGNLKYPPGQEVVVFYNPSEPGEAVIKPGRFITGGTFIIIILMMILWFWGIIMFIRGLRALKRA